MKQVIPLIIICICVALLGAAWLLLLPGPASPATVPPPVATTDVPADTLLIVAEEFVPYEYLDDNGQPTGINVDVTAVIMDRLGVDYQIRIIPWSRTWKMLQRGLADATFSTSYEDFRNQYLYYTPQQQAFTQNGIIPDDHLWLNEYVFFVRDVHRDSFRFESYEQVRTDGYKVAIIQDNSYTQAFWAADLNTYPYPTARDSFAALLSGEVDVYLIDRLIGQATIAQMGIDDEVTFIPTVVDTKPMLMPFSRATDFPNAQAVMQQYYQELARMRDSGEYQRIYNRYRPSAN